MRRIDTTFKMPADLASHMTQELRAGDGRMLYLETFYLKDTWEKYGFMPYSPDQIKDQGTQILLHNGFAVIGEFANMSIHKVIRTDIIRVRSNGTIMLWVFPAGYPDPTIDR